MKHVAGLWFALSYLLIVLPAVAHNDRTVTDRPVIAVENASPVVELAQISPGTINSASYSPDGRTLAVAGIGGIWLYDVGDLDATPRLIADVDEVQYRYESPVIYEVLDMAFSPDETHMVSASGDGTIRFWGVR